MKLVAPKMWRDVNFLSNMLLPLGWLYGTIMSIRRWYCRCQPVEIPVICIGNVTVGGSGKTPVALKLAQMLQKNKPQSTCAFLTRGYRGRLKGPILVNLNHHDYHDIGDEALLLANVLPTWVAGNRLQGAQNATQYGVDMVIMDDGLQHTTLHHDVRLMVVDGSYGFGNERIIPAGPLREALLPAIKRVDALIIIGPDHHHIHARFNSIVPIFSARMHLLLDHITKDQKIIAFAGIGHPNKFHHGLIEKGYNVVAFYPFPDHHPYSKDEIGFIQQQAQSENAKIVTTAKDYVRVPASFQSSIGICHSEIIFEDEMTFNKFVKDKIDALS